MSDEIKTQGESEEKKPADNRNVGQFGWKFDNEDDPNRFYLEIPIDSVAADPSINGIIFLLGFFENCKNEAVAQVRRKRAKMALNQNGKIILPGAPTLKVH